MLFTVQNKPEVGIDLLPGLLTQASFKDSTWYINVEKTTFRRPASNKNSELEQFFNGLP